MTVHIVWADPHIHPHRAFSRGNISRVDRTLQVVDEIRKFCLTNDIHSAICLGDVFHRRDSTKYEYFNKTFQTFSKFKADGIDLTILVGNHDIVDKTGVTTIDTFSDFATITKQPTYISQHIIAVPYSSDFSGLAAKIGTFPASCILLAHLDIIGAKVTHGWESDKGITTDLLSRFRLALLGHFHLRQQVKEGVYYIGTCCPQSFAEENEAGYFCILDDETAEVQWHYTSAPKFVKWDPVKIAFGESGDWTQLTGNYAKIIADGGHDSVMKDAEAIDWIYEPPPREQKVIQREKGISLDSDLKQVVKTYATVHAGELPIDKLVEVGHKLLGE